MPVNVDRNECERLMRRAAVLEAAAERYRRRVADLWRQIDPFWHRLGPDDKQYLQQLAGQLSHGNEVERKLGLPGD